jgi:hypothetical protein
MNITIGERTRVYMKLLCIENFPFSENELISKFRSACKIHHPDMGGDAKQFIKIKEAFDNLENLAIESTMSDAPERKHPEEVELFKTGVWEICPACSGNKFTLRWHDEVIDCPNCSGTGQSKPKCNACSGTGKFKNKSGNIVKCITCSGTGIFNKEIACPDCNSTQKRKERTMYECMGSFYGRLFGIPEHLKKGKILAKVNSKEPCTKCGQLGKIKLDLWNAVIPENAILH